MGFTVSIGTPPASASASVVVSQEVADNLKELTANLADGYPGHVQADTPAELKSFLAQGKVWASQNNLRFRQVRGSLNDAETACDYWILPPLTAEEVAERAAANAKAKAKREAEAKAKANSGSKSK